MDRKQKIEMAQAMCEAKARAAVNAGEAAACRLYAELLPGIAAFDEKNGPDGQTAADYAAAFGLASVMLAVHAIKTLCDDDPTKERAIAAIFIRNFPEVLKDQLASAETIAVMSGADS